MNRAENIIPPVLLSLLLLLAVISTGACRESPPPEPVPPAGELDAEGSPDTYFPFLGSYRLRASDGRRTRTGKMTIAVKNGNLTITRAIEGRDAEIEMAVVSGGILASIGSVPGGIVVSGYARSENGSLSGLRRVFPSRRPMSEERAAVEGFPPATPVPRGETEDFAGAYAIRGLDTGVGIYEGIMMAEEYHDALVLSYHLTDGSVFEALGIPLEGAIVAARLTAGEEALAVFSPGGEGEGARFEGTWHIFGENPRLVPEAAAPIDETGIPDTGTHSPGNSGISYTT